MTNLRAFWRDLSGFGKVVVLASTVIIGTGTTITAWEKIEPLVPAHRSYVRDSVDALRPDVRRAERRLLEDQLQRSWGEDLNLKLQRQATNDPIALRLIDERLQLLVLQRGRIERELDILGR